MARKHTHAEPALEVVAQHELALMEALKEADAEAAAVIEAAMAEVRVLEEETESAIHARTVAARKAALEAGETEYAALLEARRAVFEEEETYAKRRLHWAVQDLLGLIVPHSAGEGRP